ncbi:hypothetical protein IBTHAUMO2_780005 [Nitrosopumilaceae archaeon]|nr:hypothetical protein [Nitrosopumilus sp.]CAI9832434.1 hypothetical protein IBTHAUMO2_780005 [Nitrosopumilaceae archaeon]
MDEHPPRDWSDGEGWSLEDLKWTPEDARFLDAALKGRPTRITSYEEIKREIESA